MAETQEVTGYTVAQVAKRLHVSPSTVWRRIAAGKLPAYRVGQKALRDGQVAAEWLVMRREGDWHASYALSQAPVVTPLPRHAARLVAAHLVHRAPSRRGRWRAQRRDRGPTALWCVVKLGARPAVTSGGTAGLMTATLLPHPIQRRDDTRGR